MRFFILFILKIILIIVLLAVVLDYTYTKVFANTLYRGKVGYIFNSPPKNYDVIILGSSRADNHFVSQMFEEKGLKTFNFGMQDSRLFESNLVLKSLLERKNKIKTVIIDVDVTLRLEECSEATVLKFYPYLKSSLVVQEHLKHRADYSLNWYIPFYRYLKYDSKIGFRELFLSLIYRKNSLLKHGGYTALMVNNELEPTVFNIKPKRNKYYEEIKQICKENNINLIPIMTPICENVKGMAYFDDVKKLYPEIHNYENVVVGNQYFSSCFHMNDTGARLFTARVLKDFFKK